MHATPLLLLIMGLLLLGTLLAGNPFKSNNPYIDAKKSRRGEERMEKVRIYGCPQCRECKERVFTYCDQCDSQLTYFQAKKSSPEARSGN